MLDSIILFTSNALKLMRKLLAASSEALNDAIGEKYRTLDTISFVCRCLMDKTKLMHVVAWF